MLSLGGLLGDYTGAYTMIFRGIFFHTYTVLLAIPIRNSEDAMGGAEVGGGGGHGGHFFLGCRIRSLEGCDGWGEARGGEYYISKPRWSSGKINALTARVRA